MGPPVRGRSVWHLRMWFHLVLVSTIYGLGVSEEADADNLCSLRQFRCANGNCIPLTWMCEGEDDCGDNSDENHPDCRGGDVSGGSYSPATPASTTEPSRASTVRLASSATSGRRLSNPRSTLAPGSYPEDLPRGGRDLLDGGLGVVGRKFDVVGHVLQVSGRSRRFPLSSAMSLLESAQGLQVVPVGFEWEGRRPRGSRTKRTASVQVEDPQDPGDVRQVSGRSGKDHHEHQGSSTEGHWGHDEPADVWAMGEDEIRIRTARLNLDVLERLSDTLGEERQKLSAERGMLTASRDFLRAELRRSVAERSRLVAEADKLAVERDLLQSQALARGLLRGL